MNVAKWVRQGLSGLALSLALTNSVIAQNSLGSANSRPAATVDGIPISMSDVEAILKRAGPRATALSESQRRQMQMEALGMLIDDLLMKQFLHKYGPRVDPAEVNKQMAELTNGLQRQNKTLNDFLQEQGQTEAQLREDITNWLKWMAFVKQQLSEERLKAYYDESKDFFDRVMVRASHIVIRVPPEASPGERQAAEAKLRSLRQEIATGRIDFAEAARKHSMCTSASNGGDVGYFPRKLAVEEAFGKAAFALKVGEVSDVVHTDFGVHLIKVTDRKSGQPSDYNKIKEEVRELCVEEMRLAVLAQQRRASRIQINLPQP